MKQKLESSKQTDHKELARFIEDTTDNFQQDNRPITKESKRIKELEFTVLQLDIDRIKYNLKESNRKVNQDILESFKRVKEYFENNFSVELSNLK